MSELVTFIGQQLSLPVQHVGDHVAFLERGLRNLSKFVELALQAEPDEHVRRRLEQLRSGIPAALQATLDGCQRMAEVVAAAQTLAQESAPPRSRRRKS